MAGASTAQEALIAELLGDVGKLHDEVKTLQVIVPDLTGQLRGFIESIDRATATAQEVHQAKLADYAVEQKAEITKQAEAVLTSLQTATGSLQAVIESSVKTGQAQLDGSRDAVLDSVVDFTDSKISEAIRGTVKETLGTELRKLADFDKEVAKLKKELQSVSTEMLEHRQRGAADMAIAVKAELSKAKPSFTLDIIKIVVGVLVGLSLQAWIPALEHIFKN